VVTRHGTSAVDKQHARARYLSNHCTLSDHTSQRIRANIHALLQQQGTPGAATVDVEAGGGGSQAMPPSSPPSPPQATSRSTAAPRSSGGADARGFHTNSDLPLHTGRGRQPAPTAAAGGGNRPLGGVKQRTSAQPFHRGRRRSSRRRVQEEIARLAEYLIEAGGGGGGWGEATGAQVDHRAHGQPGTQPQKWQPDRSLHGSGAARGSRVPSAVATREGRGRRQSRLFGAHTDEHYGLEDETLHYEEYDDAGYEAGEEEWGELGGEPG
jgi:hypothetical protein